MRLHVTFQEFTFFVYAVLHLYCELAFAHFVLRLCTDLLFRFIDN
jgi:hypothetical protein